MILKKIKNKIAFLKKQKAIKKLSGSLSFPLNKAIIISGVPRGGSTWFAELLNTDKKSAIIWEPLHLNFYDGFNEFNLKWRPFFNENNNDNNLKQAFKTVLTGNRLTLGVLQKTNIEQLKNSNYLIVKFCRANRLLPYLTYNFKFGKVIHLLRHPCAVVASQLKFGAWDDVLPYFTEEELAPDGYIENYYDIIKPIKTIEEKLAAIWCLDNLIPLTQNNHNKWISITYENLMLTPEKTFNRLNITFTDDMKQKFYKPSSTTKKGSPINNDKSSIVNQLSYWKKKLNPQQIESILNIVEAFKLNTIYNDDIYPLVNY